MKTGQVVGLAASSGGRPGVAGDEGTAVPAPPAGASGSAGGSPGGGGLWGGGPSGGPSLPRRPPLYRADSERGLPRRNRIPSVIPPFGSKSHSTGPSTPSSWAQSASLT